MKRRDLLKAGVAALVPLPLARRRRAGSLACQPPSEFSEIPVSKKKKLTAVKVEYHTDTACFEEPFSEQAFREISEIHYNISLEFSDESSIDFNDIDARNVKLYPPIFLTPYRSIYGITDYYFDTEKLLIFIDKEIVLSVKLR